MTRLSWVGACLFMVATPVLAAPESCERVKADIQQRIVNNGVPETSFSLTIVPGDQVDQVDAQVVGHCANDTHKILYTRTHSGNAPGGGLPAQDGSPNEPQ